MKRTDVYLKVELAPLEKKEAERIANEIVRAVRRIFAVRAAEVTHTIDRDS